MSDTALRSRRSRAHKRGDHGLCLPANCKLAGQDLSDTPAATLTPRGATLWRDMRGDSLAPELRVLLEEACRIADRLDKLNELLEGDAQSWVALVEDRGDPERQYVVIDRPMAEARQHATVLKQLVAEIRAAGAGGKVPERPAAKPGGEGAANVTNIATWAPTRSAKSTG